MAKWYVNHLIHIQLFSNKHVSLHLHILRTTFNVQNLQDKRQHTSPRKQNKRQNQEENLTVLLQLKI